MSLPCKRNISSVKIHTRPVVINNLLKKIFVCFFICHICIMLISPSHFLFLYHIWVNFSFLVPTLMSHSSVLCSSRPPAGIITSSRTWWRPTTSTSAVRTWLSGGRPSTCSPAGTTCSDPCVCRWWTDSPACWRTSTSRPGTDVQIVTFSHHVTFFSSVTPDLLRFNAGELSV